MCCWCFTDGAVDCRYLSEFLYAWLMSTLSRADSSQIAEERILEEQLKGRSSKKTKKKKKGLFSTHISLFSKCREKSPLQRGLPTISRRCSPTCNVPDLNFLHSSTTQQGDHHESGVPEHVRGLVQGRTSAAPPISPLVFRAQM